MTETNCRDICLETPLNSVDVAKKGCVLMAEDCPTGQKMTEIQGLPPLPRCFTGVVVGTSPQSPDPPSIDNESTSSPLSSDVADVTLTNGHPDDTTMVNGQLGESPHPRRDLPVGPPQTSPFMRLNNALSKLREEMIGLRRLDLSLLTQLWSLNDAIQEYKSAMQDRYSECNSEYSFGMSRTSSMCSIDDYDWNDEVHLRPDSLIGNSLHSSTSSLLQQISELKERAESEF